MRCQWLIIAALAAAASSCGGGSEAARPEPVCREPLAAPEYRQAITADRPLLRRLKEGLRAPGLSLTVAVGGKIVWSVSCGYADLKSRRPVTAHARFRIGSVSKALTATASPSTPRAAASTSMRPSTGTSTSRRMGARLRSGAWRATSPASATTNAMPRP